MTVVYLVRLAEKLFHSGLATQFNGVNVQELVGVEENLLGIPFVSIELGYIQLLRLI
jgi:hypothetical protein